MPDSQIDRLQQPDAEQWLASLGFNEPTKSQGNLQAIISRVAEPQRSALLQAIFDAVPELVDPDRATNNLERLTSSSDEVSMLVDSGRGQVLTDALILLSSSQTLCDFLVRNPENLSFIESTKGRTFDSHLLTEQLWGAIQKETSAKEVSDQLRQFKQQQTIRIAVNDMVLGQRVETITRQISDLAIAIVESGYRWTRANLVAKFGEPQAEDGTPSKFVVLAFGKLGGSELNYSSDIDLVYVYDEDGTTSGGGLLGGSPDRSRRVTNNEFYVRLCRDLGKLIGEPTEQGFAYRVDLRLRPNGSIGPICHRLASMLQYYDLQGRTWERQAMVKAKPIAGDVKLGEKLLAELMPWLYRRNLTRADISGIKALKRKIERRTLIAGEDRTNVKTGHGGIRDVEFVIQFLQLLNAGEIPEIRTTNTLNAIQQLEAAQCLTSAEATLLSQNYEWLRKLEHRLQIMFDLQTHTLPTDERELAFVAKRMGFGDAHNAKSADADLGSSAFRQFREHFDEVTESNRKILNHLLHNSFGMAFGSLRDTVGNQHQFDQQEVPIEVELVLDPDPDPETVDSVLRSYGFQDTSLAHQNLMELAREKTRFLSSRRCKHFLASVAPALLKALADTPDPDRSLVTLSTVTDCLGAKGVLWELFSFNPPTLNLYVRLCASSDYLVGILKSNPGMIDELVDALQWESLPSRNWLESNFEELTRGAVDWTPIIHSFKNTHHMRVGIRDILGRDDIRDTHATLADVAEICLRAVTARSYEKMSNKFGAPDKIAELRQMPCPFVVLALGKLGGREPNYHSDLDVIFLYESRDDVRNAFESCLRDGTQCQFFFSELAAEITRFISHSPNQGRLYEMDSRLRPTGKSGSLAVSTDEFERYFSEGKGQLWERQALCKARPIFGSEGNIQHVAEIIKSSVMRVPWQQEMAGEIRTMRMAMQADCTENNLKRGEGGTVDVEFIIQMLQLKNVAANPSVLVPGTLESVERLVQLECLSNAHGQALTDGYQSLRSVEARLRLMNTTARHDLPTDEKQLAKLAYLLNYATPEQMVNRVKATRVQIRKIFDELVCDSE